MGVYEALRDVAAMASRANNIEIQRALMDVQQDVLDIQAGNQGLRDKVAELEEALAFKGKLRREGDYLLNDADSEDDRPYCMHCWEAARKPVHLYENNETHWRCQRCDTVARKPGRGGFGSPIRRNISTV